MTFDQWFRLSSFLLMGNGVLALWLAALLRSSEAVLVGLGLVLGVRSEAKSLSSRARRIIQRIAIACLPLLLAVDVLYLADSLLHGLTHLLTLLGLLKLFLRTGDRDIRDLYIISFFQLVASSAATTSLAFVIVFLLYLFLGFWAFLLLHLKQEGVDRSTEGGAIPTRLLSTSLVASVAALVLTALLFVTIPRVGRAFLPGRVAAGPMMTGFSEKVELGSFGKIQSESSIVMRIRLPNVPPEEISRLPLRWRGVAFDRFDGAAWTMTGTDREETGRGRRGLVMLETPPRGGRLLRQDIELEPIGTDVLFAAPRLRQLLGQFPRLFTDAGGAVSLQSPPIRRVAYMALSELEPDDPAALTADSGTYPHEVLETYLQVPALAPRVLTLAETLARGARDPFEVVRRVEAYLHQGYRYTLDLRRDNRYDPLEDFLFIQRAGNCEYFAAGMAVLLRAAGIPARVVSGFQRGEWNEFGGYLAVKQRDAHAWVEVYFPGSGWVSFDPSPREKADGERNSLVARSSRYLDAVGMQWDRYVVAYALSDQIRLASGARWRVDRLRWQAIGALGHVGRAARETARSVMAKRHATALALLMLMLAATAAGVLVGWRRSTSRGQGHSGGKGNDGIPGFYRDLLRILAGKGFVKGRGETPREFAATVEARGLADLDGVSQLVEHYYRVRYGAQPLSESDHACVAEILRRLADTPRLPSAQDEEAGLLSPRV